MSALTEQQKVGGSSSFLLRSPNLFLWIGPYSSTLLGLSVILLIWIGALYFTHNEKVQADQAARLNADNLSRAFEEHIIRSIRATDQMLLFLRESYAKNPLQFDVSPWMGDSPLLSGFNFQVVVIDPNGRMVASNLPGGATPGLDLSDREHFRIHAERDIDELFISKPILGRLSNKWSIQLTRRITMPDGSFGGVVVVSLDPEYLAQFYQSINVGENGVIALIGTDAIVRARGSKGPTAIGASVAGGLLLQQLSQANSGVYISKSQIDGIERMFTYRKIAGYPLVVTIGFALDEVFQSVERNRHNYLIIASLLTLWLIAATILMMIYQRALAKARDAAEAGVRARSEFLAMMSHEIRTPMNGIVGMAELLLMSDLKAEQITYAKTLTDSAAHLLRIINDVLDFSKLEAGRIKVEKIQFDVQELVRDTVGLLAADAQERGLALTTSFAPDVPRIVIGDPARLRQLLLNLVGNALKFTEAGHVAVNLGTIKSHSRDQARLVFTVADTGIGIPKNSIPLLFQKFSQLDSSISRRFGGTGLGLAICKRLLDAMGGAISVESQVGKGTTFKFEIEYPVLPQGETERIGSLDQLVRSNSPATAPDAVTPQPIRILLAEDNKTNQLVATKLIERIGFTADIANNGLEAVAACSRTKYDVVFMDVMMPEMDGLAATRAIRKLRQPFDKPYIIALTANAQTHDKAVCLNSGMDDYLAKPLTRNSLVDKLSQFHLCCGTLKPAPLGG